MTAAESPYPKVFVSHATEDKAHFVIPFTRALREKGVDAWLDDWEMLDGDSLVAKIFDGIEKASTVIIVLSRVSITKPWVAEELNAAVIRRITAGTRLIGVVLDGLDPATDVPMPLRGLKLRFVPDPADFSTALEGVVQAVFGEVDRPPLGERPRYATTSAVRIRGLDKVDSLVFRSAGAEALRDDGQRFMTEEFVASVVVELGISEEQAAESLDILHSERLVKLVKGRATFSRTFDLTPHGLRTYLRSYEPAWPQWEAIVNARLSDWPTDQGTEQQLKEATGDLPLIIIRLILERHDRNDLHLSKVGGPQGWRFSAISPRLRRGRQYVPDVISPAANEPHQARQSL